MHQRTFEALHQQQLVTAGKTQRFAGLAKCCGHGMRAQRQRCTFERWGADEYAQSVAQLDQDLSTSSLATSHQLVHRDNQIMVCGIEQAQ